MNRSRQLAFRATPSLLGGADNPYVAWARSGAPSTSGSKWITDATIRHPEDEKWGPTRYSGNEVPTMAQFISAFNEAHPTIEPLYHPLLTHNQKITRLYKRALRELLSKMPRIQETTGTFGFYARQVRAEFEKNRNVDAGTAEWYFVRAINYIEHSKQEIYYGQDWFVGRTSYGRYGRVTPPDEFTTFPHGFDPTEAYKLMNHYEKFGIPFMPRMAPFIHPSTYLLKPALLGRPLMMRRFYDYFIKTSSFMLFAIAMGWVMTGSFFPGVEKSVSRGHPSARVLE
eukprot:TRINITY_DN1492_c7_g1_i1.p1 TRINITY_DN1492_c7_g1~~TRINITY_DN1492_c7_g1_i1.p1  ORF type:complete len:284 (+),score=42.36 TRINITY_DN1492_c7_g1_i1:44-895(+)